MPPTILVVDDDYLNREVIEAFLSLENYAVVMAHSGKKALELATTSPPDLILLDIKMPDMNGYEVCRQLKSHTATGHIPIILLTAFKGEKESESARAAGADAILLRTVESMVLLEEVRRLLHQADA